MNDDGIIYFRWDAPSIEAETLSENVTILPYEDIQEIARKQLEYRFSWKENEQAILQKRVVVDTIKLGMMRVTIPNSVDEYMVIPVWDFYGYFVEVYPPKMAKEKQQKVNEDGEVLVNRLNVYELGASLFTINAIDGSIVHRLESN